MRFLALVLVLATAALACSGSAPLKADGGGVAGHATAGTAGAPPAGDAGTMGEAGASGGAGTGGAGTMDAASPTGAAGASVDAGDAAAGTGAADAGDASGTTDATNTKLDGSAGEAGSQVTFDAPVTSDGSATLPDGRCVFGAFMRNGVCTCQPEVPSVCGDRCTDPQTDDDNCGFCGHACGPTSTCQHGACGPAPAIVLPLVSGCQAIGVAISGDNLFWTEKGHDRVSSFPLSGGTITILSSAAIGPTTIVANGGTAFWLEPGARAIRRSSLAGPVLTVVTSPTDITNFTVSEDGNTVYFSTGTTIMKVPAVGGGAVPAVREDHGGTPGALAVQGAIIAYPTGLNGDVDIAKLTPGVTTSCGAVDVVTGELLPNPNCVRVARSQGSLALDLILLRDNRVFWADGTNLKANDVFTGIQSNDNIAQTLNTDILGMAATASTLYFGEGGDAVGGGIVYKSPTVRDSIPVRIARGQKAPRSLAVSATKVYWSTGDCTINATGL